MIRIGPAQRMDVSLPDPIQRLCDDLLLAVQRSLRLQSRQALKVFTKIGQLKCQRARVVLVGHEQIKYRLGLERRKIARPVHTQLTQDAQRPAPNQENSVKPAPNQDCCSGAPTWVKQFVTPRLDPGEPQAGRERANCLPSSTRKNRAEFLCGRTDMTYDPAISSASVAAIWSLWRARPGNIVIPGHDIPMALKDGQPQYLAKREDAIKAWFGDDIDTMTTLELSVR